MLLAARLRVPGRGAVHVLLRARDQGQVVRSDPEKAAAVVPGPAAPWHRRQVRGCRHHVADGVQQSGRGQRHQRPQRVHRERSELLRGTRTRKSRMMMAATVLYVPVCTLCPWTTARVRCIILLRWTGAAVQPQRLHTGVHGPRTMTIFSYPPHPFPPRDEFCT